MTIETKTAVRKLGDGSIPAAAALTGEEVVLGLQDGESVEISTQGIADLGVGGGGTGYTYTPTVTSGDVSGTPTVHHASYTFTPIGGSETHGVVALNIGLGVTPLASGDVTITFNLPLAGQPSGFIFGLAQSQGQPASFAIASGTPAFVFSALGTSPTFVSGFIQYVTGSAS